MWTECQMCSYYWQEADEDYPSCHWESACPDDIPPCEEDDYDPDDYEF